MSSGHSCGRISKECLLRIFSSTNPLRAKCTLEVIDFFFFSPEGWTMNTALSAPCTTAAAQQIATTNHHLVDDIV